MAAHEEMSSRDYAARRQWIADYFGRTAAERWANLTTDAPVGRIAGDVREGRAAMLDALLKMLPRRLDGRRVLDAGSGTGAAARALAERGASVVAVDVAPALVDVARARTPENLRRRIEYRVGDMTDDSSGTFDHVFAMDSLIHYTMRDAATILARFAAMARSSVVFTFAPRTPLLAVKHAIGRLFPVGSRSPAIEPVTEAELSAALGEEMKSSGWRWRSGQRVHRTFYISQAAALQQADEFQEYAS